MQCSRLWGCKNVAGTFTIYRDRNRKQFWNVLVLVLRMMKSKQWT